VRIFSTKAEEKIATKLALYNSLQKSSIQFFQIHFLPLERKYVMIYVRGIIFTSRESPTKLLFFFDFADL